MLELIFPIVTKKQIQIFNHKLANETNKLQYSKHPTYLVYAIIYAHAIIHREMLTLVFCCICESYF